MADNSQQEDRDRTRMADKSLDDFDSAAAETPPNDVMRAQERVRQRAYQLWEESGRGEGQHEDHWLQAEREIDALDESTGRSAGP